MTDKPIYAYQDPDYVQGQLTGLTAMLIAIASFLPRDDFLEQLKTRIQAQRDVLVFHNVSDLRIKALDDFEKSMLHTLS
ncbi:hypothetical protein WL21_32590 [Burkholderia ubonensis]|uniref:hypothetical protein n=1 Tax=Burkholderia ubonensis TaxID=101571 RepID=UPI0007588973|nr:hypothetical protein [Burkholderia ubonensis]KVO95534.1 hypothetical protein WJ81_02675 [Burkholderia ubonensis]KVZ58457.1 hypothetical protein WL20_22325 [Burkholderia ubonensis]KVZ75149.1 hypothetical protein WL21_32590 [Burkholderia ubonensis]